MQSPAADSADDSATHAINLAHAWEVEPGGAGGGVWVRRFGRPTGLAAGDSLWLVIDGPTACTLLLNGAALPACRPGVAWRCDIMPLVHDRNLLVLVPQAGGIADAAAGRLALPAVLGRVRLEIVAAAPPRSAPP